MTGGREIQYIYDAADVKLAKIIKGGGFVINRTDYAGSYVYEDNTLDYQIFSEGRKIFNNGTWQYEYHLKDHLGNVRVAFSEAGTGTVKQENHYYPFGLRIADLGMNNPLPSENKYLYNSLSRTCFGSKEMQDDFGLDWLDYGFRFYDPQTARWSSSDPKAEQRYWLSPYQYAQNSPLIRIDPDGMLDDVVITGNQAQAGFNELQNSVKKELKLSMDAHGYVSYTLNNSNGALSSDAQQLVDAIDNHSIVVNVNATSNKTNNYGEIVPDGAFMGNYFISETVEMNPKVNFEKTTVVAEQQVNPSSLKTMGDYYGTPGKFMLHEVTEAYQGALNAQETGIAAPRASQNLSLYKRAHKAATNQPGGSYYEFFDKKGNRSPVLYKSGRAEYSVDDGKKPAKVYFKYP